MLLPGAVDIDVRGPLAEMAEHGVARLGRVLNDEGLELLRARTDDLMLGRVTYPGLFFQGDSDTGRYEDLEYKKGYRGPSLKYRKIEKLEKDPLFLAWIENALFERVARAWIDGGITIYRAVLFNKPASGGTTLPFHQDGGSYWGLSQNPTLQIWTALDDAPIEAGCVEVIPGSHKDGLATPLGGVIPEAIVERTRANERTIPFPARAGEALLIHNHVWHRSGVNTTGRARRALTICYMSAAARCMRTKRAPRVFFEVFRRAP